MSDIVERLRMGDGDHGDWSDTVEVMFEAAAEIERLEAALRKKDENLTAALVAANIEMKRLWTALREEAEELRGAVAAFNQTRDLIPKTTLQRREDDIRAEQGRVRLARLDNVLSGKGEICFCPQCTDNAANAALSGKGEI